MPRIIEFPNVVQDAMAEYGEVFANECQRRHFCFGASNKQLFGEVQPIELACPPSPVRAK